MKEHTAKSRETAKTVVDLLSKHDLTIAVAEATCCGLLGYLLTCASGSSGCFLGGLSPYSTYSKTSVVGIPDTLLTAKGSVSREAALDMASRAQILFNADIGLAETGIAGPCGGTHSKPVGLFYIAISTSLNQGICKEFRLSGQRDKIRQHAALSALDLVEKYLRQLI